LVKKSAIDGSCMFDSIAQGLAHILEHDVSAFGGNSSRSAQEAIRALTNPMLLRQMICDHLCGPFADVQLACLQDQSPRQSAIMDYVDHGYPLLDADWKPSASNPKQVSQTIKSFADYIAAMRKKGASGDEICLAASADLLSNAADWGRWHRKIGDTVQDQGEIRARRRGDCHDGESSCTH
jgi:hypothetical protein